MEANEIESLVYGTGQNNTGNSFIMARLSGDGMFLVGLYFLSGKMHLLKSAYVFICIIEKNGNETAIQNLLRKPMKADACSMALISEWPFLSWINNRNQKV
ncbi:MAG: hypothetical protein WD578_14150 [Bacteroidales bacterium]